MIPTATPTKVLMTDATAARARMGVFLVFAANGILFASWASRLPDLRAALGLTPGEVGLLLLAATLGSLAGLPLSGRLIERIGTRGACMGGNVLTAVGFLSASVFASVAHAYWPTWICLLLGGFGIGVWDVGMNHEGAIVEQRLGRAIMPWFHAAFSAATVVAALIGAGMTALSVPVSLHLALMVAASVGCVWFGTRGFLRAEPAPEASADGADTRSAWLEPRTLAIGLVLLAGAFTEGAANDWIAIAFVDGHHLPAWLGVLAFAVFLGFMTVGRVFGTHFLDRYGRVPVLRTLFVLALIGSVLVIFGTPQLAFAGAVLWGLGASMGFPVGMSAAADDPARAAARLSVVSTIGYLAFLGGPPLVGFLGDHVGVLKALLAVAVCLVPAWLAVPVVREPGRRTA